MLGYRVPAPDDAMLISGGKHAEGAPFRVVVGHGAFVLPFFRKVRWLGLDMRESEVQEPCVTRQGIELIVKAVIAFKVGNDDESIIAAGQRFVSDESNMPALVGRIFAGHLRSVVGSMTVEEIITERQKLAEAVLDASKVELAKIGLVVDSFQIQSIDDQRSGYVAAMAAPQRAAIQRAAEVAQAQADQATAIAKAQAAQAAAEAEQESKRKQSDFAKATALVQTENDTAVQTAQAANKAKVDQAQAAAAQAGPLSQAKAQKDVVSAQSELAQQQAELRERQLRIEVVKPAEADAEKVRVTAEAAANERRIMAEAAVAGDRVTLDQQLITLLPSIVEKAAGGLAGANVTVLNGADGVSEIITQVVAEGMTILDTLRKGTKALENGNGSKPAK